MQQTDGHRRIEMLICRDMVLPGAQTEPEIDKGKNTATGRKTDF